MTLIPNKIKFATSATTGTIKVGNFILGINDSITYGPTSVTGFYQGLSPVFSGYTVYQNKVSGGPSTFRPNNDSEFIGLAKALGGTNVTGVTDGLVYLNSQSSIIAVNRDYEDIVTSGLRLIVDAGFTPSYPRSGTTIYDMSLSGNNGTLTNGPYYSGTSGGSIVFDGVDDLIVLSSFVSATTWTISTWFKTNFKKIKSIQYCYINNASPLRVGRNYLQMVYVNNINSIVLDSSGNLFVGGWFTEYNGISRELILKLDTSGNLISEFNANIVLDQTKPMSSVVLDSSGNTYYGGYNMGNLTKINPTTGAQIQQVSGVNATITQANIVLDEPNNKVYIAGWFTTIQGVAAQRIARLNLSTMTIDSTFNTTTGFVDTEDVQSMILQPDGKLIVGGRFTSYKSSSYNRIIRLNSNASIDTSFVIGTGFNGNINKNAMVLQPDGKIIIGGEFTSYSGVTRNRIIRLNSDGTIDSSFSIGTGFNSTVSAIALQSDGKIIVGGFFTVYSGTSKDRIVRLLSDGTFDTSFNSGGTGFNQQVQSLCIQPDDKIICGLALETTFNNTIGVKEICRLNSNGTLDTSFTGGTIGIIGGYRLNSMTTYRNSSNVLTDSPLYSITEPIGFDWRNFNTANSVLSGTTSNFTMTKDSSGVYRQYWNGALANVSSLTSPLDTNIDFNRIGTILGDFNEMTFYNRELTSSEIIQNFQAKFPRYLGENIVTNGLVSYFDAGYNPSFPTTGQTKWGDVSGYNNSGDLTNGPTYSSLNGGSIVFDGVNDYINNIGATSAFTFIQNTAIFTIDVWVKPNLLGTAMYFMGNNDGTTTAKGFYLGKQANDGLWLAITRGVAGQLVLSFQPVNFFTGTNWVNITITCDGTTAIAYKNGTQFTTTTSISTLSTGNSQKSMSLGRINDLNTSYWNGNISITRIYNRPLSQTEITQNFNSQKSRFGL